MEQGKEDENNINHLSNAQVILLSILVSVVSAVAAAIAVASLYDQNPNQTITKIINRATETVVEKETIELPGEVKTYVIKEGDLVAKAVAAQQSKSIALAFITAGANTEESMDYGFIVGDNYLVTTPIVSKEGVYTAGTHQVRHKNTKDLTLWQTKDESIFTDKDIVYIEEADVLLGQTMIFLSAKGELKKGIVTKVNTGEFEFSESLSGLGLGMFINLGGDAVALWNGEKIVYQSELQALLIEETGEGEVVDEEEEVVEKTSLQLCTEAEGELNEYGECVGVGADTCLAIGGEFNECASACRHDEDATICTLQCVLVCQL